MKQLKQILFKPEHFGFIIGALCVFIAYETTGTYRALLIVLLTLGGLGLVRKLPHYT